MKHFNFKKILLMLTLMIIMQSGTVMAAGSDGNTDSYSDDGGIAPCSDLPPMDEDLD